MGPDLVLLGSSSQMKETRRLIERLKIASIGTILIEGPSGTGKGVVARLIHNNRGPFEPVDCCAMPEDLVEDILFGHERGAFTTAVRSTRGAFALAENGTLFLDEIGDMPLFLQGKLLRVLEEHEFKRVGGEKPTKTNVRIMAATNKNLWQMVRGGKFREDLYYRLAVVKIGLPPLRERREDIPELVDHFRDTISKSLGLDPAPHVTAEAMGLLKRNSWPGNVREIRNCLERALVLHGDKLVLDAKMFEIGEPASFDFGTTELMSLRELERTMIFKAMEQTGNDKRMAARLLGISLKTIYNKLAKYGIRTPK